MEAFYKEYGPQDYIPWYLYPIKHRYLRLITFIWACIFTSNGFYGWQSLSTLLFKSDVYRWKCTPHEADISPAVCPAQYQSVQTLYTVGIASEYILTLASGLMFDNFGPMYTAAIGEAMHLAGWLLLLICSQARNFYVLAFFLIGGSVNVVTFPTLVCSSLFPKHSALAMSFVIACQSIATAIPPALDLFSQQHPAWSFHWIIGTYVAFGILPAVLIFPISCPYSRADATEANSERPKPQSRPSPAVDADAASGVILTRYVALGDEPGAVAPGVSTEKEDKVPSDNTRVLSTQEDGTDWSLLWSELRSIEWIVFTTYYVIQVLQNGFFPTTVLSMFGPTVSLIFGIFVPLQALFGILIGFFVDRVGTLPVVMLLITSVVCTYLFGLLRFLSLWYAAGLLFVFADSYIYTTKYVYFAEVFSPRNFGTLTGITGTLSGVMNFANIPILNSGHYRRAYEFYLVVGLSSYSLIALLMIRQRERRLGKLRSYQRTLSQLGSQSHHLL